MVFLYLFDMKLTKTLHKKIMAEVEKSTVDSNEISLTKSRGWIHIHYNSSQHHFSFYRKNVTHIDPENKTWVAKEEIQIQENGKKKETVLDWNLVFDRLSMWLEHIKK